MILQPLHCLFGASVYRSRVKVDAFPQDSELAPSAWIIPMFVHHARFFCKCFEPFQAAANVSGQSTVRWVRAAAWGLPSPGEMIVEGVPIIFTDDYLIVT